MKIDYVSVTVEYTKNNCHSYQKLEDIDHDAVAELFKDVEIDETEEIQNKKLFIETKNKFEEDFARDFFATLPRTAIFKGLYGSFAWTRVLASECDRIEVSFKYWLDNGDEVKL